MAQVPSTQIHHNVVPLEVGWQFVPQYYGFINKQPNRLHCFYTKASTFIHGTEGEEGKPSYGQQEIHNRITAIGFQDCKVFIHSVDAQSSANNGIVIQAIGEMSNAGGPWRKFVQTFFLAEQPNGYFVLNDIFRFLKEETVEDEASEADGFPAQESDSSMPVPEPAIEQEPDRMPSPAPAPPQEEVTVSPPSPSPSPQPETVQTNGNAAPAHEEEEPAAEPSPAPSPSPSPSPAPPQQPAVSLPTPGETTPAPSTPAPSTHNLLPPAASPAVSHYTSTAPTPSAPAASTAASSSSTPAPPPQTTSAPAPPPQQQQQQPTGPPAPKTWANLAATNSKKWGGTVATESRGISENAAPSPISGGGGAQTPNRGGPQRSGTPSVQGGGALGGGSGGGGNNPPSNEFLSQITTPQVFIKGVADSVSQPALNTFLTSRFGPLKDLELVRSRGCAFVEFNAIDSARRAIAASLSAGGVRIEVEGGGSVRLSIETRRERGDRPVPGGGRGGARGGGSGGGGAPGGGQGQTGDRGGYRGRGGAGRGRGGQQQGGGGK